MRHPDNFSYMRGSQRVNNYADYKTNFETSEGSSVLCDSYGTGVVEGWSETTDNESALATGTCISVLRNWLPHLQGWCHFTVILCAFVTFTTGAVTQSLLFIDCGIVFLLALNVPPPYCASELRWSLFVLTRCNCYTTIRGIAGGGSAAATPAAAK